MERAALVRAAPASAGGRGRKRQRTP